MLSFKISFDSPVNVLNAVSSGPSEAEDALLIVYWFNRNVLFTKPFRLCVF